MSYDSNGVILNMRWHKIEESELEIKIKSKL